MAQDAVEVVKSMYDAFTGRDIPLAFAIMAEDIEWSEAENLPWGGFQRGSQAVAENVFGPTLEMVPDLAITPEKIVAEGDTVAVIHRYHGTAKSGGTVDVVGVAFWEVKDDKIVSFRQFVDTVKFNEALAGKPAA
jgi:ketosteroid isomerase-like protein